MTSFAVAVLLLSAFQDTPAAKPPEKDAVSGLTVSGARQQVETAIDRRSYSVAADLNGRTGTVADVLRNVPSVQVDPQGNLSLRGDGNVTVLVDGRPSAQFNKDNLATALTSIPADQIDRIEVITNPSAEYRADGSAGIINLVMKKARGAGRTGSLRVNASSTSAYDATLSTGFNSDKLSVVDSLSFRHQRLQADGEYSRTLFGGGGSVDRLTGSAHPNAVQGRIAIDYDLDARTRLSASANGGWVGGRQLFLDDFVQMNAGGASVLSFSRRSDSDIESKNGQLDFTLRRKWSEAHNLTLNTAFSSNEGLNYRIDLTKPGLPPAAPLAQATERNNYNRRAAFTADYQRQLSGGVQLKAGYLLEYTDNLIQHAGGFGGSPEAITPDPAQTDDFSDRETHHNAYITLQKKMGQLTALGGLRAEAVHLDLDQRTLGMRNEQDYRKLYPTLHLAWALGKGRSLTASYSKRVTRPIPIDLDPFRFRSGAFNAIQGNPQLKPQDTDSYEIVFEKRRDAAFTLVTAYYRRTNNAFSNVLTDLGDGLLLQTRDNLGYQSNAGVEWAVGNRLSPKLTYNLSINAYRTQIGGGALGFTGDRAAYTGFGRANLNWQVSKKDFIQLNLFANSKQLLRQGYIDPSVSGNIGYRHAVTDKLSLMLVARDPFGTLRYKGVFDLPTGREVRTQRDNSRAVSLALIWNFAGKSREAGFDFAPGGTGAGGGGPL